MMLRSIAIAVFGIFTCHAFSATAPVREYPLHYQIQFQPDQQNALVEIRLINARPVKKIRFAFGKLACSNFASDNKLVEETGHVTWYPEGTNARFHYQCKIDHKRQNSNHSDSYDAYISKDFVIVRGDDLVPPARVTALKHSESRATMTIVLPSGWNAVNSGWPSNRRGAKAHSSKPLFFINDPERKFDRPIGWIIAGKLGTRRAQVGEQDGNFHHTELSVSAPLNSDMRRMDILTFLSMVWPQIQKAFVDTPERITIVGGNDPLWRGGLSATNSLYLHADRPMVSENGTSSVLHEIFHVVTRIHGGPKDDWIAEGLAEYYSVQLLLRSGAHNEKRYQSVMANLQHWCADVKYLRKAQSTGATTAAAVLLFADLDREIQTRSKGTKSLDDLVRILMRQRTIDLALLQKDVQQLLGNPSQVLAQSALLAEPKAPTP